MSLDPKIKVMIVVMDTIGPMNHYSQSILRSICHSEELDIHLFCLADCSKTASEWKRLFPHISSTYINKPRNRFLRKLLDLWTYYYDFSLYINIIYKKPDCLHILAPGAYINNISILSRLCQTLLTVHDAVEHTKIFKSIAEKLTYSLVYYRNQKRINFANWLVTLSQSQFQILCQQFGKSRVLLQKFPSLITSEIINGNTCPNELQGIKNYILFFGRIESYKGVDILYNWFNNQSNFLVKNLYLVIAGHGNVYFKRSDNENNIIFINRFIEDNEIRLLITYSLILVLPYRSATQSGPVTLGRWFRKRMVLSDVAGLSEFAGDQALFHLFDCGDMVSFACAMESALTQAIDDKPSKALSLTTEDNLVKDSLNSLYKTILHKG